MTVNNKIAKPKRILSASDRARLCELLRKRLIECGWKDQVRMLYHQIVRECEGENITYEMIISKMTPRAHALIPEIVKKEFIKKIIICRGPRILKYVPNNQNGPQTQNNGPQVAQEDAQLDIFDPELAQVVPHGVQYGPQVAQLPQIEQHVPAIAQHVLQGAQEVPQMDQ